MKIKYDKIKLLWVDPFSVAEWSKAEGLIDELIAEHLELNLISKQ
jgi:hypothetical protein